MVKDVWAWVALFTKLLKPFWLLFPENVVTRLLLIFHSGNSGVPAQSETIWSQFNILPLTYYSSTCSGGLMQEAAVLNRGLHPWIKWHNVYLYMLGTYLYMLQ